MKMDISLSNLGMFLVGLVTGAFGGYQIGRAIGSVMTYDRLIRSSDPHHWRVASETRRSQFRSETEPRQPPTDDSPFGMPTPGPMPAIRTSDSDVALIPSDDLVRREREAQNAQTKVMQRPQPDTRPTDRLT